MELLLHRKFRGDKYTIGTLSVDGVKLCDTLEPTCRRVKIKGSTAIAEGYYRVIINESPRFCRELPRLCNVPDFEGVLIHRGNTVADTAGCILPGDNIEVGKVLNSTKYELLIVSICKSAIKRSEQIYITVE
ncbi:MAG: DUF5675 family protein [Bacteroidales bacterium]